MLLSNVAQGTCGTQVRHRGTLHVVENVIGHRYQRVLLSIHLSVLLDECQAVHIGVDHHAEVVTALGASVHDAAEVLGDGLRIVCEVAIGLTIEEGSLHAERLEQVGQDLATHRVDRVDDHLEVSLLDGLHIHKLQGEHRVDVALVERVVLRVMAEAVNVSILKILSCSDVEHLVAVVLRQELTLLVEQLERIPVAGVVAGGDDDTTCSTTPLHGELCGRRSGQADVHHIVANTHERTTDHVLHHLTRDTCVASNHDLVACRLAATADEGGVSRCKLHNVKRVQSVARTASDGTTDARNRFDKGHKLLYFGG